jgi:hypothetical protein
MNNRKTKKQRLRRNTRSRNTRSRRIRRMRIKSKKYIGGVKYEDVPYSIVKEVLDRLSKYRTKEIPVSYESDTDQYTYDNGIYIIGTPILTTFERHEYNPTKETVIGDIDYTINKHSVKIVVTKMKPLDTDKNQNPIYYFYNWSDEFVSSASDPEYTFKTKPFAYGKYQYDETKDKVPYGAYIENDPVYGNYSIIRRYSLGETKDYNPSYSAMYIPLIETDNADDFKKG